MHSIRSARMFIRFNAPCSEIGLSTNQNYSYSANGNFFSLKTSVIIFLFVQAITGTLDYGGMMCFCFWKITIFSLIFKVSLDICHCAGKRFQAHLLANNEDIRMTAEVQCDRTAVMYCKVRHYWTLKLTCVFVSE